MRVCVCDELVAVRTTYKDRRMSLLCVQGKEGDYGALKTISMRDNLRQKQGTAILWFSLCECAFSGAVPAASTCRCVCLHMQKELRRTVQMIWTELSLAFSSSSPPHSSSIFVAFRSPPLLFHPAFTFGSSSKGECQTKYIYICYPLKNSYILFMCQKYWHQPWHNIPEQQSAVLASPGFIILPCFSSFFFFG